MKNPAPTGFPDFCRSLSGFLKPTLSEDVPHCLLKRPEPPQAMSNQPPVYDRRQPFAKRLLGRVFGASDGGWVSFPAEERDHPASATPPGLREPPLTQPISPAFFSMAGETPSLPIFVWPAVSQGPWASRPHRPNPVLGTPTLIDPAKSPPTRGRGRRRPVEFAPFTTQPSPHRSKPVGGTPTLLDLPPSPLSHTQPHIPLSTMN
jgi:hypothetical protein